MSIEKPQPTEYKINNFDVVDFFDTRFVGAIKKQIQDAHFQHFCLYILDKEDKPVARMTIGHDSPKEKIKNILTVTADTPQLLEKLMNAIIEYKK